jgi:putative methyltransferase (TIGR04325 family)
VLDVAQRNPHGTSVVDFGGGLGGTYHQCRPLLANVRGLHWKVVEQKAFAECGQREFQTDVLQFYGDLDAAAAETKPDVVLFSGVLQYLPEPEQVLAQTVAMGPEYVVIDRTPFLDDAQRSILALQLVPKRLGGGRYPAWLFREEHLLRTLLRKYTLVHTFDASDGVLTYGLAGVRFRAFILRKTP